MHSWLTEQLGLDKELVCEFLLYFSRFEYALKRAGFVIGNDKKAEAAWDNFANSLRGQFATLTTPEFQSAIQYLDSAPPRKQVLIDGRLGWADNKQDTSESKEAWILRLVRTVRNNQFHGGKYPGKLAPNPERDQKLLRACLVVLDQALEFSPRAKMWFDVES